MNTVPEIRPTRNTAPAQLPLWPDHYTSTQLHGEVVALGVKNIADAKRYEEDHAGGLAALVCGYGRGR